jgi:hypothetical protein
MNWQNTSNRLPPLIVGTVFTLFDAAKVYGLARGVYGGRGARWTQKLVGQCPPGQCRAPVINKVMPFAFLLIGIVGIANFILWFVLK